MYKQHYIKELKYIIPVFLIAIYCFRLLGLMSDHKVYEWPVTVPLVSAQEPLEPTPAPIDVTEWGIMAEGYEEVVVEIQDVWGEDAYMGLRIAHCESRFGRSRINTNKDNSHDISVFQINDRWHSGRGDLLNWHENIRIGYEIYKEQGGTPWVCFKLYSHGW